MRDEQYKIIVDGARAAGAKFPTNHDWMLFKAAIDRAWAWQETPSHRQISAAGLALIKASEGLRLKAYRCPADVVTIGFGSTGPHVKMGMTITEAEAEALLIEDLSRFEKGVSALAPVTTQGQFDALTSFAFNVGLGAFGKSTLLKKHLAGDCAGAAKQFARWNRGGGRVLAGLTKRREAERKLYTGEAS